MSLAGARPLIERSAACQSGGRKQMLLGRWASKINVRAAGGRKGEMSGRLPATNKISSGLNLGFNL